MSESRHSPASPSSLDIRCRLHRRKRRKTTSCWPCRDRKVKCDQALPCDICKKRGYPDLCNYGSRDDGQPTHVQTSQGEERAISRRLLTAPGTVVGHTWPTARPPKQAARENTAQSHMRTEQFLGSYSIPGFVRDAGSNIPDQNSLQRRSNVERGIMPILGLQGTQSMYPFMPSDPAPTVSTIHDALPSDREIIKLFQCHRSQIHAFTPIVSDIDRFEVDLCTYIEERQMWKLTSACPPNDTVSLAWLGLLFALLASGVQFSDVTYEQRLSLSHDYMRSSFQALRLSNFLLRPTIESVQAFLILGNVLQNDGQPDAAWVLLGTTIRLAQSIGLHQSKEEDIYGKNLWLAAVWQDSLLSMCFGRRPSLNTTTSDFESDARDASNLSYADAMRYLIQIPLQAVDKSWHAMVEFDLIAYLLDTIEKIHTRVQPHLQQIESGSNIQHRCEYYALRLHTSFVMAWLSRGAMRKSNAVNAEESTRALLISRCKHSLVQGLRAYLQLLHLCLLASRAWAMIHNGISSALLLGLIGETRINAEVRQLQGELIALLSNRENSTASADAEDRVALSSLHRRALLALKDLYNEQTQQPSTAPATTGDRQPRAESSGAVPAPWDNAPPNAADANLQSMADGAFSPLEMFDSIVWDPEFSWDGFSDSHIPPESWTY